MREKADRLTPQSHEDREEDSGWVVKQVACSGGATGCRELPVATGTIAERAHGDVVARVTDLHTVQKG